MKTILLFIIAALIIAATSFYFINERKRVQPNEDRIENPATATPAGVPSDWQTFQSAELNFMIQHPPNLALYDENQSVSFVHAGPTQTEGSELYDGFAVNISTQDYQDGVHTLQEFAERKVADDSQHGQVIEALAPATLAGHDGFRFKLEGLGTFTTYILPHTDNTALLVTYLVADPDNRSYQETVNLMLDTLSY